MEFVCNAKWTWSAKLLGEKRKNNVFYKILQISLYCSTLNVLWIIRDIKKHTGIYLICVLLVKTYPVDTITKSQPFSCIFRRKFQPACQIMKRNGLLSTTTDVPIRKIIEMIFKNWSIAYSSPIIFYQTW